MAKTKSLQIEKQFATFLDAPTRENQERLADSANEYREAWIEAKATGQQLSPESKRKRPTTSYEREFVVEEVVDQVPIRLALQQRTNELNQKSWWVHSWRTCLAPSGYNRRFYATKGEFWRLPATVAMKLIQEMDSKGGLADRFRDDRYEREFDATASTDMSESERSEMFKRITSPDEDWGPDPFFVVAADPNPKWLKVMLINRLDGMATFRSITADDAYKQKKALRPNQEWYLDNSMMDANVQQMRVFHHQLKALNPSGDMNVNHE